MNLSSVDGMLVVTVISVVIAGAAAYYTRMAVHKAEQDAKDRRTLELLHELEVRSLTLWQLNVPAGAARLESEMCRGTGLSPECAALVGYLNILNLIGYAVRHRLVNEQLTVGYLQNVPSHRRFLMGLVDDARKSKEDALSWQYVPELIDKIAAAHPSK